MVTERINRFKNEGNLPIGINMDELILTNPNLQNFNYLSWFSKHTSPPVFAHLLGLCQHQISKSGIHQQRNTRSSHGALQQVAIGDVGHMWVHQAGTNENPGILGMKNCTGCTLAWLCVFHSSQVYSSQLIWYDHCKSIPVLMTLFNVPHFSAIAVYLFITFKFHIQLFNCNQCWKWKYM